MPYAPRFRRRREDRTSVSVLTKDQDYQLRTGSYWFWDQSFRDDLTWMESAWREHGARLTRKYIDEQPGHRPFAAWLFDLAPQIGPRPLTPFGLHLERQGQLDTAERRSGRRGHVRYGLLDTHSWPRIQQLEALTLHRHHLLAPGEWERWLETDEQETADGWMARWREARGKGDGGL